MRSWRSFNAGLIVLLLAGCQGDAPPPARVDRATHFRAVVGGTPVHLALEDCTVFFVAPDGRREEVLSTDFYPMLSACKVQEVSANADFIHVELGRQALGAGGCCATGGTWRSRDVRVWERRQKGKWVKPAPPAPPAK